MNKYWYVLHIAYDGTDFSGWQWQPHQVTIQETIRVTFLYAFKQTEVYLVGASRTDAGVHAQGQVARLGTTVNLAPAVLLLTLNKALPQSIRINSCEILSSQNAFHPQHNVASKTYQYRIFTKRPCPTQHRYGYFYWNSKLDLIKLKQTLQLFVGTHDFKSFAKYAPTQNSMRTIMNIDMAHDALTGEIIITVIGVSFLQHMIRRIVGAALAIASDADRHSQEVMDILMHNERITYRLPTAPAQGLCLKQITYQKGF